jgi:hypothetical protein
VKTFAKFMTAASILLAGLQWWQIVYRLNLFYSKYGRQRYANHIGDDIFVLIHIVNFVLLIGCLVAAITLWREPGTWRWFVVGILIVNAIAWLTFSCMHSAGVLVGYTEFIRRMKGGL